MRTASPISRPLSIVLSPLALSVAVVHLAADASIAQEATPASAVTEIAPPTAPEAPTGAAEPMVDAPWFRVGWPKVEMPKVRMPDFDWKPWGGGDAEPKEGPRENPVSETLDKVSAASKRAADGVRGAWGGAMNKISSFGSGPKEETIASNEQGGWWSRLFRSEPEQPSSSQSVSEFLAQERAGTTLR